MIVVFDSLFLFLSSRFVGYFILGVEFDEEAANELRFIFAYVVMGFDDKSFCKGCLIDDLLHVDLFNLDCFCPEGVEGSLYIRRLSTAAEAVELEQWPAVSFHLGRRQIFSFEDIHIQVKRSLIQQVLLNVLVHRNFPRVQVHSTVDVPSDFKHLQSSKRFVPHELIDIGILVADTGLDLFGLDPRVAHPVLFLRAITEIDYDVRHLRGVLRKLNLLILKNVMKFAHFLFNHKLLLRSDQILSHCNDNLRLGPLRKLEALN